MDCVVLAAGRPGREHDLYADTRGAPKALLELGGRPMVDWVLDGLLASRAIDRIVLVGLSPDELGSREAVELVPDQGELVANLYAGIERLGDAKRAAYCWSDIPLLGPEMIDRFVSACDDDTVDIDAGLVARETLQARFPEAEDLWLRLREGRFIAADFGVFALRHARRVRPHLERLAPQRKSALRQAWSVGLPVLARYVSGRLSVSALERHLGRRYGLRCRVHVVGDPELGLDVDSAADLALCRRELSRAGR